MRKLTDEDIAEELRVLDLMVAYALARKHQLADEQALRAKRRSRQ